MSLIIVSKYCKAQLENVGLTGKIVSYGTTYLFYFLRYSLNIDSWEGADENIVYLKG